MTILTRRKDQVSFKGNPVCAEQIIGGIITAETRQGADNWITRLFKTGQFNYFVRFQDTHGPAIQFGFATWVTFGYCYVDM